MSCKRLLPRLAPALRSRTIPDFTNRSDISILGFVNPNLTSENLSNLSIPGAGACYRSQKVMSDNPLKRFAATMIDKWSSPIVADKLMPDTLKAVSTTKTTLMMAISFSRSLFSIN